MSFHQDFSESKLLRGRLRFHFTIPLVIFAALLGACAIPITFITGTNVNEIREHMPLVPAMLYPLAGIVSGTILAFPALRWMSRDLSHSMPLWLWLVSGLVFGGLLSVFTGAILPLVGPITGLFLGELAIDQLPRAFLHSLSSMPLNSIIHGSLGMFTSLQAGCAFIVAGILIDHTVAKQKAHISNYGPWIILMALGIPIFIFAFFGDPDLLFKVGRLGSR